ncbi:MAG: hypothetical protein JO347_12020 [Candidatus Eremiobacteraeota bacterium]|nr:hypothetical protein [Candidatus Eremiobacteraeota bacterium]
MLAQSRQLFDLENRAFPKRLGAVQRALYLLFNEGYHGASPESAIRAELCREAIRLTNSLLDNPLTATPASYALAALMHLNAARLPGRVDASGALASLVEQDRSRWDRRLIDDGQRLLERSASGEALSEYHVEAAIAWAHADAPSAQETDWAKIVAFYDLLMKVRNSPVVALNRAIAIAQLDGPQRGLEEIGAIADRERLGDYPFYFAALGELEFRIGNEDRAREHFLDAMARARNPMERQFLERKAAACVTKHRIPSPA